MFPDWRLIGVVSKVLFHSHERILHRFFVQVLVPGFFRSNLENNLGSGSGLADAPTSYMLELYPFDDSNIRSQGILFRIGRLIEVEVFIDGTDLPTKEPGEHLYEIVHELGVNRGFPHQILLGGVEIVVVCYLVFNLFGHGTLPSWVRVLAFPDRAADGITVL